MKFRTDYIYTDRETKAKYVWHKYSPIIKGEVLDVGANKCYIRKYLDVNTSYTGIDLGGTSDIKVDLEKEKIPFNDRSFDCVICTDVLEHLDNIHNVFDEICRVSRGWVIVSFPSPWRDFYTMLRNGYYNEGLPMKFYNLPVEPPQERHKWFFSTEEAERFIAYRSEKNGFRIIQMDSQGTYTKSSGIRKRIGYLVSRILFSKTVNMRNLYSGTLWAVLERQE